MNAEGGTRHRLFVYGTLRENEVQHAVFGRTIDGEADTLPGYRLGTIEIRDDASGAVNRYLTLISSRDSGNEVGGIVLQVSDAELAMADAYEGSTDYERIAVRLKSGRTCFVYVGRK